MDKYAEAGTLSGRRKLEHLVIPTGVAEGGKRPLTQEPGNIGCPPWPLVQVFNFGELHQITVSFQSIMSELGLPLHEAKVN